MMNELMNGRGAQEELEDFQTVPLFTVTLYWWTPLSKLTECTRVSPCGLSGH